MPFQPVQQFHEYLTQPWSEMKKTVASTADLAMKFGDNADSNGVWKHAVALNDWIEYITNEGDDSFSILEKQLAGMLDIDMANDFIESMQKMDEMMKVRGGVVGERGVVSNDIPSKFKELCLNEETTQRWGGNILTLARDERKSVETALEELANLDGEVYYQLYQINVALGLELPPAKLYTVDEIRGVLFQESEKVSFPVLARSLMECMRGDNWHNMSAVVFGLLGTKFYNERIDYSWDDAFIFTILLHTIFARFENLPDENWSFSVLSYLYRAVVAGVPVRQKISDALYTTRNMVDYVLVDKMFFEALKSNTEQVIVDIEQNTTQSLGALLSKYHTLAENGGVEGYNTEKFIQDTYGAQKNREAHMAWLREILYIFIHLKKLDMIDHNYGGELTPKDEYFNEMVELVANFGIGKDGADFIVDYFSKPGKRVPFAGFLNRLKEIVNLEDNVAIENCVELSVAFREVGLIPRDSDLVIFDEKTGKFHWNEELFK